MGRIVYLTSSPDVMDWSKTPPEPLRMNTDNSFIDMLRNDLPINAKCLMIASNPDMYQVTDWVRNNYETLLPKYEISVSKIDVLDHRVQMSKQEILQYDFIVLCGGHVPTQNKYFHEIGLQETLQDFQGVIMGISAGSMNSASICYAQPELDEEVSDSSYVRYLEGLGLTNYMLLPHWQYIRTITLAGKRVEQDITYPDSMGHTFYALVDGSFLKIMEKETVLYGEAYKIQDGKSTMICKKDEKQYLV